jgi:aryl-alcohol dehydrogenase-like predicted oxidoreductase
MEYRKLGNTDLQLSAITYGAFAIGGNMWGGNEEQESIKAIQASIDHGVTTIDTAPFYGFGLSEELIGKAVAGYDRSKIQLLTKFGLVWDQSNNGKGEFFFDAADDKGNGLLSIRRLRGCFRNEASKLTIPPHNFVILRNEESIIELCQ